MAEQEVWKPIPGYPDYEVSNKGRVRSFKGLKPRILKPAKISKGYLAVALSGKTVTVHSLVALAFIGPRPTGLDVCHNDDDPQNNNLNNLRYDTRKGNISDLVKARKLRAKQLIKELLAKPTNHPASRGPKPGRSQPMNQQAPVARRLTDLLSPASHQRIIDRLTAQIDPATPELNKEVLAKIEWHTNEYQKKTGELPR